MFFFFNEIIFGISWLFITIYKKVYKIHQNRYQAVVDFIKQQSLNLIIRKKINDKALNKSRLNSRNEYYVVQQWTVLCHSVN